MRKIYYLVLVFILLFGVCGCGEKKKVQEDLICTLDFLISEDSKSESYLYTVDIVNYGLEIEGIFKYIAEKITYKISSITVDENKATAVIQFITPDVQKILSEISVETEAALLEEKVKEHLESEFPMKEYEVTLELKQIEEHWYLIPNAELSNVMTGGMVEWYSDMGMRVIERLMGGMENE